MLEKAKKKLNDVSDVEFVEAASLKNWQKQNAEETSLSAC